MVHQVKDYEDFKAQIKGKVAVVDYFAEWCPPCKMIAPIFAEMAEKHKDNDGIVFLKVDVDKFGEMKFPGSKEEDKNQHASIRAMPTFRIFNDGEFKEELVGANKAKLEKMVADHVPKAKGTPAAIEKEI